MTTLRLALVALLATVASSPRAQASCNTIPEHPMYVGERGSTDRPFLSPDGDQKLTVSYGRNADDAAARAVAQGDVLVTLVFKPPGAEPSRFFIAPTDKACRRLAKPRHGFARFFCHARRNCVTAKEVGLRVDSTLSQLSFRVPETGAAGPVTVAITSADRPAPIELQKKPCSIVLMATRESGSDAGILACIDKLGPPVVDPPGDPVFTELVYLPPSYDYSQVCTHHLEDPKCTGNASDIDFTMGTNGDVAMRVKWEKTLRPKANANGFYRRSLRAGIAVGATIGELDRIRIPSAAFLQTTTTQGGGFIPSPEFTPVELDERPEEQTFFGTADQGDSVLVFARRRLWQLVCDAGTRKDQACEPVATGTPNPDCPSGQCTGSLPWPGEYFACVGGDRARLPCTQTVQCPGAGATCEPISKKGNFCYLFGGTPMTPEKSCFKDSDCGAGAECGPGLFDFRNRPDLAITNGIGTIKRLASQTRGVCDSGLSEGNKCRSSSDCTSSGFRSARCVRFRASALKSSITD